jgi:hypothetical protein
MPFSAVQSVFGQAACLSPYCRVDANVQYTCIKLHQLALMLMMFAARFLIVHAFVHLHTHGHAGVHVHGMYLQSCSCPQALISTSVWAV